MDIVFIDGHIVFSRDPVTRLATIGVVLSDDGFRKMRTLDSLCERVANMSICTKYFERRDEPYGTLFVCPADDSEPVALELEIRDLEECLNRELGLILVPIENEHLRQLAA